MSSSLDPGNLTKRIQIMQIVAAALTIAATIFLIVVVVLQLTGHAPKPPKTPTLTYVGIVFTFMVVVGFATLPQSIVAVGRKRIARNQGEEGANDKIISLCGLYQTSMLIGLALLEGAIFFQLLVFQIEGQQLNLLLAMLLLTGMVLQFPTRPRVESWIEKQQEKLNEEHWV
jgi:hypothetical protein